MLVTLSPSRIEISDNGQSVSFQGMDIVRARIYVKDQAVASPNTTNRLQYIRLYLSGDAMEAQIAEDGQKYYDIGPLVTITNQPTWLDKDTGAAAALADITPIIRATNVPPGSVSVKNSIEYDGGELQLVGDDPAPGPDYVYGTDGSGNKGWKPDPSGGAAIEGLTGDVSATGPGTVAATIQPNVVTNSKLADMAQARFKLRAAGSGSGDPIDGNADQASTILDAAADPFVRTSALPADDGITQLTGDVTAGPGSGSQTATIANDSVTNAKLADMAGGTIKGLRVGGGTSDPEDLDAERVSQILDTASDPFVRTSALPADTGITQLTGDVTAGPGSGSQTATIANQAVTFAKMQHISTAHLLGRHGAGTGDVQQIGIDGGLELQGSNLRRAALTGDVTASAGDNATTIANDAVTNAKMANMAQATIKGRAAAAGTGDPQDLTASEARTALALGDAATLNVGTTTGTVAAGDDSRFTDARTPTAHAASHGDGGSDEIAIDASQMTSGTINTARLGSGTANSTTFLRGDNTWATPAGGGGGITRGQILALGAATL